MTAKVMEDFVKKAKIKSHFLSIPYQPQSRRAEKPIGIIKEAFRVTCLENRKHSTEYEPFVDVVASAVNDRPSEALEGLTPRQLFLVRKVRGPLDFIASDDWTKTNKFKDVKIGSLQQYLDDTRNDFARLLHQLDPRYERLDANRDAASIGTHPLKVQVGSYVLIAQSAPAVISKSDFAPRWSQLSQVTRIEHPWKIEVQTIIPPHQKSIRHPNELKLLSLDSVELPLSVKELATFQQVATHKIQDLLALRRKGKSLEILTTVLPDNPELTVSEQRSKRSSLYPKVPDLIEDRFDRWMHAVQNSLSDAQDPAVLKELEQFLLKKRQCRGIV